MRDHEMPMHVNLTAFAPPKIKNQLLLPCNAFSFYLLTPNADAKQAAASPTSPKLLWRGHSRLVQACTHRKCALNFQETHIFSNAHQLLADVIARELWACRRGCRKVCRITRLGVFCCISALQFSVFISCWCYSRSLLWRVMQGQAVRVHEKNTLDCRKHLQ